MDFEKELQAILEHKPPVSASKISTLCKISAKNAKHSKQIVYAVEKFITKCPNEYKLSGLYVADAIIKYSLKNPSEMQVFITRFEERLSTIFTSLNKSPSKDKEKMKKVLGIWKKSSIFKSALLNHLQELIEGGDEPEGLAAPPDSPSDEPRNEFESAPASATLPPKPEDTLALLNSLTSAASSNLPLPPPTLLPVADATGISMLLNSINMSALQLPPPPPTVPVLATSNELDVPQMEREQGEPFCTRSIDSDLPTDCVRVLSRTLYVGGIHGGITKENLRRFFEQAGRVSTVQIHYSSFNAFVKMYTRKEAEEAFEKLDNATIEDMSPIKVKWGCGWGPKQSFDFSTGTAVLQLSKITEKDLNWLNTSTRGGGPLKGQVVFEEPDVIIGGERDTATGDPQPYNPERHGGATRGRGGRPRAGFPQRLDREVQERRPAPVPEPKRRPPSPPRKPFKPVNDDELDIYGDFDLYDQPKRPRNKY